MYLIIFLKWGSGEFEKCGFEAEMGTNLESSQMILKNLYDGNWLNNATDVIMFEQTYFNGYINSFLMLRVSFEHVSGGAYHGQLRLKVN